MDTLGKVLGLALDIIELVMQATVSILIRVLLWLFVVAWFSPWLATLLLIAIVAGVVLKQMGIEEPQIGVNVALFVLSWMSVYGLTGDWRAASVLVGAVYAFMFFNDLH